MRVLVGCECSQTVTVAFRARGIECFSCDLAPSYGDLPQFHFQGDIRDVFDFVKPDLFIAHPPCTYLSKVGSPHLFNPNHSIKNYERYLLGLQAAEFWRWCYDRPCFVAVENPIPIKLFKLPRPDQIIQPFYFGDPYIKCTFLWLRGLPPLNPNCFVEPVASWTNIHKSAKLRSKTFPGIAAAMAEQWGCLDLVGRSPCFFF